jgi:hypothetical protein
MQRRRRNLLYVTYKNWDGTYFNDGVCAAAAE